MQGEWFGYYVIDCVCICYHTSITLVGGIGLRVIGATNTLVEMIVIRCIIGISVRTVVVIIIAVIVIVKREVFRLISFVMTICHE